MLKEAVYQQVWCRIGSRIEDGPGGAGNTVTLGLTTTEEWLMVDSIPRPGGVA